MNHQNSLDALARELADLDASEREARMASLSEEERRQIHLRFESVATEYGTLDRDVAASGADATSLEQTETYAEPAETRSSKDDASRTELSPDRIGDYWILNTIAVHGQGAIYRANHPHLNRQVVIKVSKETVDVTKQEHVLAEGRALASLSHPNLAQVFDLQFDAGRPYLVMEYIEGRNLAEQLTDQPMLPRQAGELVATLAHGIQQAHSVGIIHQDLKPANVVIRSADQTPKIIDFGLARMRNAYTEHDLLGTYGGTVAYMAPEQAEQLQAFSMGNPTQDYDERVDVFALGAILYELLTGKRLYQFEHQLEGIEKAIECDFDRSLLNDSPKYLRSACLKALAKNPSERFRSATQLAEALQPPRRLATTAVIGSIAAAIGLVILLAVWWNRDPSGQASAVTPTENGDGRDPAPEAISGDEDLLPGFRFTHVANQGESIIHDSLFGNGPVHENDDLRIEIDFSNSFYCFLFAINPDGNVQLCFPEGEDSAWDLIQESPVATLVYPSDPAYGFGFTDGVGQQAFVLVRSQKPLPSFREWMSRFEDLPDALQGTEGQWIWQRGSVVEASRLTGRSRLRGTPRRLRGWERFDETMTRIDQSDTNLEVFGITFPVVGQ